MKIMVGLSGGVDSAIAAYFLKKQGHEVAAGFMRNWDAYTNNDVLGNPTLNEDLCPPEVDYNDAKRVCETLDIPLYRIDFVKEYWDQVFSYFLKEYALGRTPNPDIFCNKYIKFASFKDFAASQGYDYIAMGHYAKKCERDGKAYLCECADESKDQTYFLSQISQAQLQATFFPLADVLKKDVRRIAAELGLSIATKKDSTGVCFIGERHFKLFLKNYIPSQPGPIIDIISKAKVGTHEGVYYYTIGQRKGLGIGGISDQPNGRWFVCNKDVKNNILYVTSESEQDYLYGDEVVIDQLNFITDIPESNRPYGGKFRYRQKQVALRIMKLDKNEMIEKLDVPLKAITPGQAAVIYDGHLCLGGGIIKEVYANGRLLIK